MGEPPRKARFPLSLWESLFGVKLPPAPPLYEFREGPAASPMMTAQTESLGTTAPSIKTLLQPSLAAKFDQLAGQADHAGVFACLQQVLLNQAAQAEKIGRSFEMLAGAIDAQAEAIGILSRNQQAILLALSRLAPGPAVGGKFQVLEAPNVFKVPDDKPLILKSGWVDAKGFAAQVQAGSEVPTSSDETIATFTANGDGTYTVTPTGIGTAQITLTADADLGDGVKSVSIIDTVEIVAGEAVGGSLSPVN